MKLMRIGDAGKERPALLDADGTRRDLSGHVDDIAGDVLTPEGLARLADIDPASLPALDDGLRAGPPMARPGKIICIGLNYADHAEESGLEVPKEPIIFMKATSSYSGPTDDIHLAPGSEKTDWEVELGVVIGKRATRIARDAALDHVAGYCVVNDVSERAWQIERAGQWVKGKSADTFCPTGPLLVTADEVADPQALGMWLDVDGKRMQDGSTMTMVFGVSEVVAYLSQFMTLEPGDLICTGTPPGVGMGQKPSPVYLQGGEIVSLGIEGLGEQRCQVVRV